MFLDKTLFFSRACLAAILVTILNQTILLSSVPAQTGPISTVEIPSSFNPVGSGARAIGRGGAFIAVADDATAASWNPAGLIQLKRKPEFSVVFSGLVRREDNFFGSHPEASGANSVTSAAINFLSAAGSFQWLDRNMSLSLTYRHLYDFNRRWAFDFYTDLEDGFYDDQWRYRQKGSLSAVGLSYCIQITPRWSAGLTLNLWEDDLTPNQWEQTFHLKSRGETFGQPFVETMEKIETYSFDGMNANIGALVRLPWGLSLGAVVKTPFRADLEHRVQRSRTAHYPLYPKADSHQVESDVRSEKLVMPLSMGVGAACRFSDSLSISIDVWRTEWDDFVYKNENGDKKSPISGRPIHSSDIDATHQVRAGVEYLFINKIKQTLVPVRFGLFYDPAPAEGSPDDFYGFSLGTGMVKMGCFSLDVAYQLRYGDDVGAIYLDHLNFSQDVVEHKAYFSMIFYGF